MRYLAFIHSDRDSTNEAAFGISFPDFPGCVSDGDSIEEVVVRGGEALSFHIAGMVEDGEEIPRPRSSAEVCADPELADWREGAELAWVAVIVDTGRPRRINISIDAGLLEAIDIETSRRKMTRSAFLSSAARREITQT